METVLTEELDEEEQLVRRHRKEKKELQGDGAVGNPGVARTQGRECGASVLRNVVSSQVSDSSMAVHSSFLFRIC